MQKWEYLFVSFGWQRDGWHVQHINGEEQKNWKTNLNAPDFSNGLGAQGWELVSVINRMASNNLSESNTIYTLIFKRPLA